MPSKQTCNRSVIPQFLNEELEGAQLRDFTEHLANCIECQQAIEKGAAEDRFWRETVEQLAPASSVQSFGGVPKQVAIDVSTRPSSDTELSSNASAFCEQEFSATDQQVKTLLELLSPTDDPKMLGRIGDYEVSGVVGIGGMGAVLKGFDKSLMRVVAIKVMSPHLANKGSARKRFEREARAAAAISHDNVVDIYRVDELNGLPYLVMPFARGPSLQTRIDRDGPLSAIETVLVGKQIASGLAAAHEQGLIHRDIKPANILLNDGTERVLITDFGVARAMDDASMTQTGLIAGTPQFMSPEQARGEVVDQRSDLFSLGSLLYTVCTGRPPFRAEAPFGVLRKITDAKPKSIVDLNPEIPGWLISVIDHLMEKDPTKRFKDAQEVAELLEKCLGHLRQPNLIQLPTTVTQLQAQSTTPTKTGSDNGGKTLSRLAWIAGGMVALMMAIWGTLALTDAPDIAGDWQGEQWTDIQLDSVQEAQDWYTGSFTDGSGNQGAIHLEWSRLGQRFQGRWSTSQEKSGAIVLRPADARSVRGAISFDSDAVAGKDELRLRDFVWREGKSNPSKTTAIPTQPESKAPTFFYHSFYAPNNAVVKRIFPGVAKGRGISQGDYVAELETGEQQFAKKLLAKLEKDLEVKKRRVDSLIASKKEMILDRERFRVNMDAEVQTARSKLESKIYMVKAHKAKAEKAEIEYQHMKRLHTKKSLSEKDVEVGKRVWDIAQAEYQSIESEADELAKKWENTILQSQHWQSNSNAKIAAANAKIEAATKDHQETQDKIETLRASQSAGLERQFILAPISGTISRVNAVAGKPISKGEPLLTIGVKPNTDTRDGRQVKDEGIAATLKEDLTTSDTKETNNLQLGTTEAGQSMNLTSAVEMLALMADLDAKIAAGKDRLAAEQAATSKIRKSIKNSTDTIEAYQIKLKSISESDAANDTRNRAKNNVETIRLKREIAAEAHQRLTAQTSLEQSQKKVASLESELDELARQRQAMIDLVLLECSALKKKRDRLTEMVRIEQMLFEQGDLTGLQREATQTKLEAVETKFKQLDYLLNHFNEQATEKAKTKEPTVKPSLVDDLRLTADAIARDPGELGVRGALKRRPAKTDHPMTEPPATEEPKQDPPPKTTIPSEPTETTDIDALIDTIATKQKNVGLVYRELSTALSATKEKRIEAEVRGKSSKDQLSSLTQKKNNLTNNLGKLKDLIEEASSAGFVERNGKKINTQQLKEMAQIESNQVETINAQLNHKIQLTGAWENKEALLRSQESDLSRQLKDAENLLAQLQSRTTALQSMRSAVFNANAKMIRSQRLDKLLDETNRWLQELDAKIDIDFPAKETVIEKK